MSSNINFNDLWKQQSGDQPAMEILLAKWKVTRRSNMRKVFFTNILFALTSLFIIWIWIKFDPQLFTTKTGIVLVILSMAVYGMAYNSLKPLIKDVDNTTDNKEYLKKLLALKSRQIFLHSSMLNLYFVLLSLGLFLYMIEPTQSMSIIGRIGSYALTFGWVLFNWFYVRPKMIKKQESNLNEMIKKVKEITGSIDSI